MKNSSILAGSCCLLLNSISLAEDKTDSLLDLSWEELTQVKVIIATGSEQPIHKASATVTVINADDIKKTGATNLADILESVPGVHIKYDSFGSRPLIHMRGANSHQTLLMVNGNPMKDLVWAFGAFWKGIPASAIARVEVIRGPGSALYGADAVAGVINVITKTAAGIKQTEMGMRAASFDTQTAFIQSGGEWYGHKLGITAEFSTTDGYDPRIDQDASGFAGKAQYGWDNQDIRFSIAREHFQFLASYMSHDDLETGMTGGGNLDPVTSADDERYDLDLIYNNQEFSQDWGLEFKLHYQDLNYSSGDGFRETHPDVTYTVGKLNHISSSERQARFESIGQYSGISDHSIRIGAGYNWQDLYEVKQQTNYPATDNFSPEESREIYYLFVQDVWSFANDWELTIGARYDHYSDFGGTVNPRLALVWQSSENLTTKFLYGQAFRAPSFQELYFDTSRSRSNPNLDPEESETLELAFSYAALKNLQLGLNIYQLEITNNISKDSSGRYQNTGRHKIHGVEIELDWQIIDNLTFSGNYAYNNPDNNEFRNVTSPQQSAYFRSDWQFIQGWNWDLQANWVADRERSERDSRSDMDDYIITDTTLRYTGLKQWEFAASVRNLFDEDAREHIGQVQDDLPLPERNFYAEIRYKF